MYDESSDDEDWISNKNKSSENSEKAVSDKESDEPADYDSDLDFPLSALREKDDEEKPRKIKNESKFVAKSESDREKRFEYLLQQTEDLSKLINSASDNTACTSKKKKKTSKGNKAFQFDCSPDYIDGEMRDYQVRGLNWMINLYENGLNGILADEMGLGKTLQTISLLGFLRHHKNISGKHIVFAPKSTLDNWINEFKRWCPEIRVVGYFGNREERGSIYEKIVKPGKFDVMVSNYEMCINESSVFRRFSYSFIVVDEGHRMKNEKNRFAQTIRSFRSTNRLLLTGTPLQNNMHELWALLNFLLPDIFKSADDFDNWFDTDKCLTDGNLVQRLHKIIGPFLLRRLKSEVEFSLLPKLEYKLYCGITKMQRELYIKVLKKEFEIFHPVYGGRVKTEPSQIMMQLRQLVNHPYILPGVEPQPFVTDESLVKCCGKLQMLDKLLVMLKNDGSRVLIFTQFIGMLDILEDYLNLRKFSYSRLDGDSNFDNRKKDIASFNIADSDKFVFIISTRAGGLGINLQTADAVIVYDSDWNPQSDIQAIDRAHRIGQKKQVKVFRLIAEKTVDERIVERAEIKLCLDKKVIQEGRLTAKCVLKKNEVLNMINYDADFLFKSTEATVTDEDIDQIIKKSMVKAEELKKKVEANEVNFDTIFKFDGELYKNNPLPVRGDIERRKMKEVVYVSSEEEGESDDDCLFVENPIVSAQRKIKFEPDLIINFEKPILQDFQFYPVFTHNLLNKQYYNYLRRNISEVPVAVRRKYQFEIENAASLLPDQIVTKKRYLKNGHSWSRQQFDIYLDLLEETGRNKITSKNIPFKTPEEVQRFHNHFWNHYESIKCSRVKEVVNTVMLNENKRSLAWIMSKYENPLEEIKITGPSNYPVDADRFMLYRMHELSQDPKNEENIPEKILQEMKNNEKFSELMVEKNEFDIINHCEALIQSVKQGMKDLMVMENPKDIMQANAKLSTRTQFIGKYKKPVLHEMQFFPQRLHELVEMEHYTYNRILKKTLEKWVPMTSHIRDEMDWLRKLGFPAWSTDDVQQFLRGLSTVGTQNSNYKTYVKSKTETQVRAYSQMFWSRFNELKDYSIKKLALDILKKEKEANGVDSQLPERVPDKIYELDCLDNRLESQVIMRKEVLHCDSMADIVIPYSENLKEEGFCNEIDQFLVWKMTEIYASDPKGFNVIHEQMLEMEEFADKTTPYSTLQLLRCRCKDLITAYIESVVPEPAEIMRKTKIIDFHFNEAIAQLKVLRDQETALLEKKDILRVARENCDKNDARKCQSKINANEKEIYWLQKQMVALNQKGFITWSRKFFLRFVEAFQRLGRFNIKAITQFVVGKSLQEVQEYSDVFWKRFEELEEDVIRNLASDVLDREMLMKLQRFMKIKGIPRNDNEIDYQLMLILRDIQWKDLKNVMGVIIHKSGELLKGKSKAVVRSRCNRLVKTYHFSLAFCNNGEVSYSQNEQKAPGLPPDSKNSVSLLKPLELRANDKPKSMKKAINPLYVVRKLHAVKELLPATTSATNNSNLVDLTSDDSMDGLSEASTSHFVSGLARGIKRPASLANDQENGPKKFKINLQHGAKNIIDALKAASKDPSRELPKNGFDDDDDSDIEIIE